MCGIIGIIGKKANEQLVTKMLDSQKHRGPDYTGNWIDNNIALGHNRLSIIDTTSQSNQPFFDATENFVLIFNGEIYNYLELKKTLEPFYNFKTSSDTEVLIAAYIKWGKDCLEKLNGMFSFAIWDKQKKQLFAVRDRFGVKPLFYTLKDGNFAFSSEIKALWKFGIEKKPNKKVWANYFIHGSYGMPNESFWEEIHQLPGGHYLEYSENKLSINRWYFFEEAIKKYDKVLPFETVKTNYANLLLDSIKLRFRADVPVGFNISGGLDSSTLLTYVNKLENGNNVEAFTFYTNNSDYDELPWVEKMIQLTKNPLTKVLLNVAEIEDLIKKMSYHQDEPFGGIPTVAYSNIFKDAKEKGITVLLDGQGMDEQWAGYDYYTNNIDTTIQGVKKSPFRKNVLSKELLDLAEKPNYPTFFNDDVKNKQYRDLFYTKIPRSQRFNDRISMAYSTELREPFLDYRLIEMAFSQPLDYKINNGTQKYLLRELVSEFLSDSITYAPKRPLQTPQREWLGNELKDFVSIQLEKIKNSEYKSWFNLKEMQQEWQRYLDGDQQSSFHIWQWVNFSLLL